MTKNDIKEVTMATGQWNKTRAFVTVKFENGLVINGVKVIEGSKGYFVGMPSVQRKNKETQELEWKDCCFIPDDEDRKAFQNAIIDAYNAKVGKSTESFEDVSTEDNSFF